MQNDNNCPSLQAKQIKDKIPAPLLVISVVTLPIISYMFLGSIYYARYDLVAISMICGVIPWLLLYVYNKGSKLAWDENRVYERPSGWRFRARFPWIENLPWRSLAYDEIASLDGVTINDPAAKSFLLPFQLLRLGVDSRNDEFDERDLWIYSLAYRDKDLAPLLRELEAKCPGMLPDIVRDRLAKRADNDL